MRRAGDLFGCFRCAISSPFWYVITAHALSICTRTSNSSIDGGVLGAGIVSKLLIMGKYQVAWYVGMYLSLGPIWPGTSAR